MADLTPLVLIELYQRMADHTAPECANTCNPPHSCCDEMYCEAANRHALSRGVTLQPTGHPRLPFMSVEGKGCVVPPHLRPICTVHTCEINSLGFKRNDPPWTVRYFDLRNAIEQLEWKENDYR